VIGIDRKSGRRIDGFEQFVSRVTQIMTTSLVGRAKRPKVGSKVRDSLSANMSDSTLVRVQSASIEAFYNKANGLHDFVPSRCIAQRHATGLSLFFEGKWQGRPVKFEVPLDVFSTSKPFT